MNLPTKLDKSKLDLKRIATDLIEQTDISSKTEDDAYNWLIENDRDIFIFDINEAGFKDWDAGDYAKNMSLNDGHGQPYAFETDTHIVMHDYC